MGILNIWNNIYIYIYIYIYKYIYIFVDIQTILYVFYLGWGIFISKTSSALGISFTLLDSPAWDSAALMPQTGLLVHQH